MVMSPTTWSKEMETGIIWQDFQHKGLLSNLTILHNAILNKDTQNLIQDTLKFLDWYIKDHFGIEEQYMEIYDYPSRDAHLAEHQKFISNYQSLKEIYNPTNTSAAMLCFDLNQWFINHINKTDKMLGDFIISRMSYH